MGREEEFIERISKISTRIRTNDLASAQFTNTLMVEIAKALWSISDEIKKLDGDTRALYFLIENKDER